MATRRIRGAGVSTLEGGMDGGKDASLIGANQVASSCNLTMRGAFAKTRNPFANLLLDDQTNGRFTGRFQGAMFYAAESGTSGAILSVGGKLFRIQIGLTNVLTEITPKLSITVLNDFSVPAPASNVTVDVTSETPFTIGETIFIDSGQYIVVSLILNQIVVEYIGGAANPTAPKGSAVLDSNQTQVFQYQPNPANKDFIYMFQAENYAIILGGQNKTIIYDGASARQAGINELPPAVFGLYAWGRIWLTLNDLRRFIAGDIVYGPSGTPQNGFRDAILKVTENDFLNEGGAFSVPNNAGPITSMFPLATQDTSLGIGPILIGTTNSIISCNAPVDRTTWKNLTYPIQTISLLDYGPQGPWAVCSINGDAWYRALNGFRSFIVARRDMAQWGNTPVSREVSPITDLDSVSFLPHASLIYFDNRMYSTANPLLTPYGIAHRGMVTINYDLVSDLRQKLPAAWEGAYSGLQVLQFIKGNIGTPERGFCFVLNNSTVELWELKTEGYYDQFTKTSSGQNQIVSTSIESFLETRREDGSNSEQLKRLYTATLFIDEIIDDVSIRILYRPDEYPEYTEWVDLDFCASVSQCIPPQGKNFDCTVWKTKRGTYAARVILKTPTEVVNRLAGGFLSSGYEFQFRIEGTGHYRLRKWTPQYAPQDDKAEGEVPTTKPECLSFSSCSSDFFDYNSRGMNVEFSGIALIPNGASTGTVTGLGLGFLPTKIDVSIMSPTVDSEVLVVNSAGSLSADGFTYILSGLTDSPCYKISYTLKM